MNPTSSAHPLTISKSRIDVDRLQNATGTKTPKEDYFTLHEIWNKNGNKLENLLTSRKSGLLKVARTIFASNLGSVWPKNDYKFAKKSQISL